MISEFLKV